MQRNKFYDIEDMTLGFRGEYWTTGCVISVTITDLPNGYLHVDIEYYPQDPDTRVFGSRVVDYVQFGEHEFTEDDGYLFPEFTVDSCGYTFETLRNYDHPRPQPKTKRDIFSDWQPDCPESVGVK